MIFLDRPSIEFNFPDDVLYMHYRKVEIPKGIKYLVTPCSGTDHIDFGYCKNNNIKVIYLDDKKWLYENVYATAEHTVYLMLRALKHRKKRSEGYNRELRGKVVGIIGFGRIGQQVSHILKGFGCTIMSSDNGIENLFYECDIITVHVPLTDETRGLIKINLLSDFLKSGGVFVNVSRPEIVEDCHGDFESVISSDYGHITNHMAGFTKESRIKTDEYVRERLMECLNK